MARPGTQQRAEQNKPRAEIATTSKLHFIPSRFPQATIGIELEADPLFFQYVSFHFEKKLQKMVSDLAVFLQKCLEVKG